MNSHKATLLISLTFLILLAFPRQARPIEISNLLFSRGVTVSGHSGLLFTKGGTSIPEGNLILGTFPQFFDRDLAAGVSEKKFTLPLTLTYGLPYHLEAAGKIAYASVDDGSKESGLSEAGLSLKWSFLQKEGLSFPSMAAGVTSTFALGDKSKGLSDMESYGLTVFLSGSVLIDFSPAHDYAIALYGEADMVFNDPGKDTNEEHAIVNAGALFPIPPYSDLGFILELTGTVNRGFGRNRDFIRIAPSFRYNYREASFTGGVGYVIPNPDNQDSYLEYTLSATMSF